MVYHKCKNKNKKLCLLVSHQGGFSLVELIVVLGIFALLFSVSESVYTSFKSTSNLKIATGSVVEALRYAKTNSEMMKGDSRWGVEILTDKLIIFKGGDYGNRDVLLDQSFDFPSGVKTGGMSEIVFEKMNGSPVNVGIITITNNSGSKNITINEKGTITY